MSEAQGSLPCLTQPITFQLFTFVIAGINVTLKFSRVALKFRLLFMRKRVKLAWNRNKIELLIPIKLAI